MYCHGCALESVINQQYPARSDLLPAAPLGMGNHDAHPSREGKVFQRLPVNPQERPVHLFVRSSRLGTPEVIEFISRP